MNAINKLIQGIFNKTQKNEKVTELEWLLDIAWKDTGIDKGTINKAAAELAAKDAEIEALRAGRLSDPLLKSTVDPLLEQIAALSERVTELESNLRFYDGLILGDSDHDKIMLARDGAVFMKCFRLLGMDISGASTEDIPDEIERLKLAAALGDK